MDIQSDMLFNSTMPKEKFEKEKGIIVEEMAQSQSRPDYQNNQFYKKLVFSHSAYELPVLGTPNSIDQMNYNDMVKFYHNFYVPNNMILMVVGDLSKKEMIEKVQKWYGPYPRRQVETPLVQIPEIPVKDKIHIVEIDSKEITVEMVFPAPAIGEKHFFAFQLLSLLFNESGSLNLKSAVESATKMYSSFDPHPEFSTFSLSASFDLGGDDRAWPEKIQTAIAELAKQNLDSKELEGVRLSTLTKDEINAERPHFYGMLKSQWLSVGGSEVLAGYQDSLKNVAVSDVQYALTWLSEHAYQAVILTPADQTKTESVAKGETLIKKSPSGLTLITRQQKGSKIFAMHLLAKNRSALEPAGQTGIASVMHDMLLKGAGDMDSKALDAALLAIGAQVKVNDHPFIPFDDYYSSNEFSFVRFECLNPFADQAMDLFSTMIKSPQFSMPSFQQVKGMKIGMSQRPQSSLDVAEDLFWQTFAPGNPLGNSLEPDMKSWANINPMALKQFHQLIFAPKNLIISVKSELPAEKVMSMLETAFADFTTNSQAVDLTALEIMNTAPENVRVGFQNNNAQAGIIIGDVISDFDPKDRAALYVANSILSSQIVFELRERQGLAYRLGSSISYVGDKGILLEIEKLNQQLPDSTQVNMAINQILGQRGMRQLLSVGQTYLMGLGYFQQNDVEAYFSFGQLIKQVSTKDVHEAINRYLKKRSFYIVRVS